jgi:hypothetical protein
MQPVGDFACQQLVNDPMPLDPALSLKNGRGYTHAHMRRFSRNSARVARMFSTFVNHLDLLGRKRSGERSSNSFYGVHKKAQSTYIVLVERQSSSFTIAETHCSLCHSGHTFIIAL